MERPFSSWKWKLTIQGLFRHNSHDVADTRHESGHDPMLEQKMGSRKGRLIFQYPFFFLLSFIYFLLFQNCRNNKFFKKEKKLLRHSKSWIQVGKGKMDLSANFGFIKSKWILGLVSHVGTFKGKGRSSRQIKNSMVSKFEFVARSQRLE